MGGLDHIRRCHVPEEPRAQMNSAGLLFEPETTSYQLVSQESENRQTGFRFCYWSQVPQRGGSHSIQDSMSKNNIKPRY